MPELTRAVLALAATQRWQDRVQHVGLCSHDQPADDEFASFVGRELEDVECEMEHFVGTD